MKKGNIESLSGQTLFVDIEVRKKSFQASFWSFDCEISSPLIPWLVGAKKLLSPFRPHQKQPVTVKRESQNIPDSHSRVLFETKRANPCPLCPPVII